MTAVVHLNTVSDRSLIETLNGGGQYRVYPDANSTNPRKREIYWIIVKNKKPLPETKLNIHQIAENHTLLEKMVIDLANRLSAAEATIRREQAIREQAANGFTLEIANIQSMEQSTPPRALIAFPGADINGPPRSVKYFRI